MADHIMLRAIVAGDLPALFEQQREPEAVWMAAFTAKDPSDKDNVASRRALEHNGFTVYGEDRGFAEGRGAEVEEWLLVRHAP